ncbi:MAG: hypothetical protein PHC60_10155 [Heliobacteriaceae bacterium]|nr:hypothetical protein [Heliobacteriaceae bacterium]
MSRFKALAQVLLRISFGIPVLKAKALTDKFAYLKILGVGLAIVAGFAPAMVLYFKLLQQGFDLLAPLGQQGAILTLGIVLVSTMIFYFGIFYVLNTFYFAGDAESLLFLPLRAWQVLGARFTVVLCFEYLTELPFLLPPILVFGVKSHATAVYWIYALIGYLILPLVPLALASLLAVLVMRFTNFGRRKDLLRILGGIFVIVLAVAFQFVFQKLGPNKLDPVFLQHLLTDPDSLIQVISRFFPSTKFLVLALVHNGTITAFLNLLSFIIISLVAVVITWWAGEKVYFQGLIGSTETTAKRKVLSPADFKQLVKVSPPLITYLIKELRLLIRTPSYFMNCVLTTLLLPVFLVIPLIIQSRQENGPLPWEGLAQNPRFQVIIFAATCAIVIFLAVSNAITATSLSRAGKQFFISQFIPLPFEKQVQAKLLSGLIFGIIGTILILITVSVLLKINTALAGSIFLVSLVAIIPVLEVGLLIDIYRPKLDWDNEQKAVKQNLNSLFALLITVPFGGGITYITIRYMDSMLPAILFNLSCYGLLGVGLYYVLMTKGIEQYRKLEG